VIRLAPLVLFVAVTALLAAYGSHAWSWLAGPVAGLLVWSLDRKARVAGASAPAPVD
jgi:hypothetical protein